MPSEQDPLIHADWLRPPFLAGVGVQRDDDFLLDAFHFARDLGEGPAVRDGERAEAIGRGHAPERLGSCGWKRGRGENLSGGPVMVGAGVLAPVASRSGDGGEQGDGQGMADRVFHVQRQFLKFLIRTHFVGEWFKVQIGRDKIHGVRVPEARQIPDARLSERVSRER